MSLIGIDVGTTGCKAVAFDLDGRALASAYREYDVSQDRPGWAELDASRVWENVKQVIGAVAQKTADDPPVAVSVSSLGEAVVPVTAQRRILGPSMLNMDVRGEEFLASLADTLPDRELYAVNGNTLGNHYTLPKLLWLRDHEPGCYADADSFLHWSGLVLFLLGAEPAVDYSLANRTLLFDLAAETWSETLLQKTGIDPAKLPRAVPSGTEVGKISKGVADELGLPSGISLVAGAHDQCANAVGCGVVDSGSAVYGMGTYSCITPIFTDRPDASLMIPRGLNTEHHAVPGRWVCFIYNHGGSLVKWYRDTFAAGEKRYAEEEGRDVYTLLFSEMPDRPGKVQVIPAFTQTATPDFLVDSVGTISGLRLDTSRGEILRGIVEGTIYYLKCCVDRLPGTGITIDAYRATGGGAKSDAWVQIAADIMGVPFTRPVVTEAGALGAAIMAGTGAGLFESMQNGAETMVKKDRTFEPDQSRQSMYAEGYAAYRELQDKVLIPS